jgi:glycosyltransferase involved in cell wall biosynthesis
MAMKVIIFIGADLRSFGGIKNYVIETANKLSNIEFTITSYRAKRDIRLTYEEVNERLKGSKTKLSYYNAYDAPFVHMILPLTASFFSTLSRLKEFDTVYNIDTNIITLFLTGLAARLQGRRYIFNIQNGEFLESTNPRFTTKIYNFIKAMVVRTLPNIHVLSEEDKGIIEKMGFRGRIFVIPNPVVSWNVSKADIGLNKNFTVIFVGRISRYIKGIDLLATIIEETLAKNKEIKFLIVGSGADEDIVRELTRKYPDNIDWKGFVGDKREIKKLYKKSELSIITSRIDTFPSIVLEAESVGLPTIAFDVKGPRAIITTKPQGEIVQKFNTAEFSNAILKKYEAWKRDPEGYLEEKRKIAAHIKRNYDYKTTTEELNRMFCNL